MILSGETGRDGTPLEAAPVQQSSNVEEVEESFAPTVVTDVPGSVPEEITPNASVLDEGAGDSSVPVVDTEGAEVSAAPAVGVNVYGIVPEETAPNNAAINEEVRSEEDREMSCNNREEE